MEMYWAIASGVTMGLGIAISLTLIRLARAAEAASENLKYATQSLSQMVEMITKENNKYDTKY
jgi:hypothetical protein